MTTENYAYIRTMIRMRTFLLLVACLFPVALSAQVSLSSNALNFFTQFTGTKDSLSLTINNNTDAQMEVSDISLYHGDCFSVNETAFVVPALGSYTIQVISDPFQNVRYADWLQIKSPTHPHHEGAFVFVYAEHADTYYDLTFDLYHEDLKAALGTLTSFGYIDLGYNGVRDQMFMSVDNQATNGGGATQNTLECVYTATQAVGYTSRTDAQNTFNFNTEHIFPQSLYSSNQPMRSDMHQLRPTTGSSNGERGNKPFGVVTSPSWTVGGSKSNNSTFEPRDAHKGDVARAMMYFVLRYQDYSGFMAPQEAVLRQWNQNFPPTAVDSTRNRAIEALQNVRNPFVDHPEFTDRIASIATSNNGPLDPLAQIFTDTLTYLYTEAGDSTLGYFYVANQGINDLQLSNFGISGGEYRLVSASTMTIPKDSARKVYVSFSPPNTNVLGNETLTFTANDPQNSSVSVLLMGQGIITANDIGLENSFSVSPNPSNGRFKIRFDQVQLAPLFIQLSDVQGKVIWQQTVALTSSEIELDWTHFGKGIYFLECLQNGARETRKLLIE